MRAVVTGAAGFIGSHLVDRLIRGGDAVLALDDLSTGRLENLAESGGDRLSFEEVDVVTVEARSAVAAYRPDILFHLAAQMNVRKSVADPLADARTNVLGTVNMLDAAVESGTRRFIFASSGGTVYGEGHGRLITEAAPLRPGSPYGAAKVSGETYVATYQHLHALEGVRLALGNVYGPRQDPHGEAGVVSIFIEALLQGRPTTIYGDGSAVRDYVYVDDVVDSFMVAAAGAPAGRRFNVGTGRGTSVSDLHDILTRLCGRGDVPHFAPARQGELSWNVLDPRELALAGGWSASVGLEEGLNRTVDWTRRFRQQSSRR